MIRTVIADDHRVVLEGLRMLLNLEPDIEVVGEACNGREAVELAGELRPDVLVMDVTMPGLNGIVATEQILRASDESRVVALSIHSSSQIASEMIRAGASAYVVKNGSVEDVIQAIRAVASGQSYYSPSIDVEACKAPAAESGRKAPPSGASLSAREREVLQLVAEGSSSKQIARALHVTAKTIGWHRQSIMDKLDIRSIAELTKYSIREGMTPLEA